MATMKYDVLFSMNLYHSYFESGLLEHFTMLPSAATQTLMNNRMLLWRQQQNGFTVYNQTGGPGVAASIPDRLTFSFTPVDATFSNYTNPGSTKKQVDAGRTLFYFSNASWTTTPSGINLATGQYAGQNDVLPLRPLAFAYSLSQVQVKDGAVLSLVSWKDGKVARTIPLAASAANVQIDIRPYPAGRYNLKMGNEVLLDFYASDEYWFNSPFGVIEIFDAGKLTTGSTAGNQFELKFDARSTYWKYLVVNKKSDTPYRYLGIVDTDDTKSNVSFEDSGTADLADGTEAKVFISQTQITLAEVPKQRFKLIDQPPDDAGRQTVLIDTLPVADADIIKVDGSKSAGAASPDIKITSEIYVYY